MLLFKLSPGVVLGLGVGVGVEEKCPKVLTESDFFFVDIDFTSFS